MVRRVHMRCRGCGYDLYGTESKPCPECGEDPEVLEELDEIGRAFAGLFRTMAIIFGIIIGAPIAVALIALIITLATGDCLICP